MKQEIPEGWYADPQDRTPGAERWWNGFQWTAHTRRSPPPPAPPPATGSETGTAGQNEPRPSRRLPDGTLAPEIGNRLAGYVVDVVLVAIVGSIVAGILNLALELSSWAVSDWLPGPWFLWTPSVKPIVLLALWVLYHLVTHGHTVGKRVFGLRLTALDPSADVTRTQILRRCLVACGGLLVVALPAGGILGIALAGYDAYRMSQDPHARAWHDQLAGTVVVRS
ncbi:MAG: RDD family protein [Nocardioides sp.]